MYTLSLVPRPSLDLPAFWRATLKAGRSREGLGTRLVYTYVSLPVAVSTLFQKKCYNIDVAFVTCME